MRHAQIALLIVVAAGAGTLTSNAASPGTASARGGGTGATGAATQERTLSVEPAELMLAVGQSSRLRASIRSGAGSAVDASTVVFFSRAPLAVSVAPDGTVVAHRAGEHEIVVMLPQAPDADADTLAIDDPGTRTVVRVTVTPSPLAELEIIGVPETMFVGGAVQFAVQATDINGSRRDIRPELTTAEPRVATIAAFGPIFEGSRAVHPFYWRDRPDVLPGEAAGLLEALAVGDTMLTVTAGSLEASVAVRVVANPTMRLELEASTSSIAPDSSATRPDAASTGMSRGSVTQARTGDVVAFAARAFDGDGNRVEGAPIGFALQSRPDPGQPQSLGAGAAAQLLADGRFVAEQPGIYTVIAMSGAASTAHKVTVQLRNVTRAVEFVGHGPVRDRVTSDLWVWEAADGRDYAITGTWGAEGHAYFWDVTDPANMERVAEVQVDARTVNDVKVSEDGRIAVISREGASNRRNGFVVLDISNPREPRVLSRFDDQMTGGVHNVFIHDDHVYAINNGRRWDVVNIEDPTQPTRVGRFETSVPGRSVHDVWVRDGIAYQSGNTEGLIMVDVGGGGMGGSPNNPVEMGRLPQIAGWNHAVWPFESKSAGKFYVVGGDEAHPVNPRDPTNIINVDSRLPTRAMGWLHFVDMTDVTNPREVARYRVPESGPHNLWIDWEEEVMYVAYFNGGLRVVDVSGDLVGDLYRQGREIAKFYPDDAEGYVPNSPFVWGPQPHKGTIFFTDFHSGLWAIRLRPPARP